MLWVDKIAADVERRLSTKINSGKELIVRDEKTASGRVHIGSMRGVAIHGLLTSVLNQNGIEAKFLYEINDFDPMDGLPAYLDQAKYAQHMGKRLLDVPSPDGKAKNFAEYYAAEFIEVIEKAGFGANFYRLSDVYKSGKMDDSIRLALENPKKIREIYKEISGSDKPDDWLPLNVVCQSCNKIGTTKVTDFDGEMVTYTCQEHAVEWATGCGHTGKVSPFGGNASLPWKVEWPAKFKAMEVSIEGAGKDHSTKGGSRDVANKLSKEVFNIKPPYDIPYEFFLIGGSKMSSSKGTGSSAKEVSDLLPTKIFRLLLISKKPIQTINFDPTGDTIPTLFDQYDKIANDYWSKAESDTVRLFELSHTDDMPSEETYLPRFSIVAYLSQMPHINMVEEFSKLKGSELNSLEITELEDRTVFAKKWLEQYAPEKYIFKLQDTLPEAAKNLSAKQKEALSLLLTFLEDSVDISGEDMHAKLHDIKVATEIEPRDFFESIYLMLLGKNSGPKAGWFLSVLDKKILIDRTKEAISV